MTGFESKGFIKQRPWPLMFVAPCQAKLLKD
jgi:hypothetical protein